MKKHLIILIYLLIFNTILNAQTFTLKDSVFKTGTIYRGRIMEYDLGKWYPRPITEKYLLDSLVPFLNKNKELVIEVGTHTDTRASAAYSTILTQRRALEVVNYLVSQGIDPNRLIRTNHIDLSVPYGEALDLIYWRQSLHHMFDTRSTLAWCRDNVTSDGAIFCNDACPPNYMQWERKVLDWVELYRFSLPRPLLRSPFDPDAYLPCRPAPPGIDYWTQLDPTECVDSANIIPAISDLAPGAHIFYLGGCIYGLALEDIINNFRSDADKALLENAMLLDRFMAQAGMNFYFTSVIKRSDFR